MDVTANEMLLEIGRQIDRNRLPRVWNGGFVIPSESPSNSTLGVEKAYERWKASRSPAGSWKGTAGWKRSAGGARSAGEAASVLGAAARAAYGKELNDLYRAYPNSVVLPQERGFWLASESILLPGLDRCAVFLLGIDVEGQVLRSWGFWLHALSLPRWIGPRHTNFNDGSICAFEPTDGTWKFGDALVDLIDYYSVWAVRHLHLEVSGRWPGYQAVHHPYERILEFRDDEYCGCSVPGRLYRDCCYAKDRRLNQLKLAIDFSRWSRGGIRRPPAAIDNFVTGCGEAPDVALLLTLE